MLFRSAETADLDLIVVAPKVFQLPIGQPAADVPCAVEALADMEGVGHKAGCREFGLIQVTAADLGATLAQLAIAWLLSRPAVSVVIVGASRVEQIDANVKATEWRLTPEEAKEVTELAG